jgi:hypothetical protein
LKLKSEFELLLVRHYETAFVATFLWSIHAMISDQRLPTVLKLHVIRRTRFLVPKRLVIDRGFTHRRPPLKMRGLRHSARAFLSDSARTVRRERARSSNCHAILLMVCVMLDAVDMSCLKVVLALKSAKNYYASIRTSYFALPKKSCRAFFKLVTATKPPMHRTFRVSATSRDVLIRGGSRSGVKTFEA